MTSLAELRPHQARSLDSLPGEVWRPVVGYEGHYEVSNLGRVRSLRRRVQVLSRWGTPTSREYPARVLAQDVDRGRHSYGRLRVSLCHEGAQKSRLVHQIVAEAFIGPRPSGHEVAHNDGDAANNRATNLRYATPYDNTQDKHLHGTHLVGERAPFAKLTDVQAAEVRALKGKLRLWQVAAQYGISQAQVSRIQNGKQRGVAA